jgi:PAS domain S-box-containing protein
MHLPTFTLLIVEDLATDRELYRSALSQDSSCTYQLLEAESVAAGLTLCRTRSIDAILLGYKLPDGDGLEFLAALNAQSNDSIPPVVMVTRMDDPRIAVRAMKSGAQDYLVKSDLTPELLQSTMRMAILQGRGYANENARLRLQLPQSQAQAELTLQAKNQQITTIWESMTDAYITLDRQWRIVYANSAATEVVRQLVDLTPEEFLGKTHWEVFPWSVGNIVEQEYRRAVTDRVAVHFELFYEPTETWFEVHAYPSDVGLGVYFRDISERKQGEAARIQAERERDRFFEISLDLLAIANLDSYFVRLNPAWEQTLGFTTAELMAKPYLDFVHPDDRAATLATAQGLSRGQTVIRFENRYLCKDGSYRWLSWSSRPYDEQGLVYAVAYDITAQKRDEELLRQSEELNRRILESSRDCIKVVDLQGRLIYMNDYGQSLMEIDDFSTVAGSQWLEFWQGSERESAQTALSIALAGGVDRFDGFGATAKGTPKWWEVIVTPILAADGRVSQILSVSRDINDRKQAEVALRESEQKFSAIFNQTFELMGIVSLDGVLLEVNQTALDSIGALREDIAGKLFWEAPWWHTEQLQQQLQDSIDRAGKGEFIRYEAQFPHPSGVMLTTDFSLKPVLDDAGKVWKIVAEARDITERKRAERDLRESQERLQTGIEVAGVGLARFDYATNLVALSPEAAVLYGFPADIAFVTREQIHATFHPDERADLEETIAQVIDPNGTGWFAQDHRVVCPSGQVRHLSVRKQVFFDRVGAVPRPSYAILAAIDITLRKQTERKLAESEERLRAGIEVAGVGLARFDYATNLVALSPEAATLYGFAPDELVVTREQIHATFHPDERADLEVTIAQVIDPNGTGWFAQDHRVVCPSGQVRHLSVRKQVFFDRVGAVPRPNYAILAAIDITLRKQAQADLEQRNQELDSFVYIVSHDLKAPLRGIANLSEWIEEDLEGSLSVANQEQMNLLRSRVYKMEATIDGLLDYARSGSAVEVLESVSIAELLADVIDSIAPPPTFTIELPPELPTLSTRRLPLFQVLANLIGNGIKHHDAEDGSIVISIEDRGDCYEFAIADDGPGIASEHHDRMFKIFQAVNPQNRSDSTGIGLAIVKKIVEAEGGTIWLESELGKGTTFYFTWLKRSGDPRT